MFLRKKGQSTAEYAIAIALVIAVAAGVLQVALKGGIRQKNKQALDILLNAGNETNEFAASGEGSVSLYTQDYRQTTIGKDSFVDRSVLKKGGAEERHQKQQIDTTAVSVETMEATE